MGLTYDVRKLPAALKKAAVLSAFDGLYPGEECVVICDFDTSRLESQFKAFFDDDHSWVCLQSGPPHWHIQIGKRATDTQRS